MSFVLGGLAFGYGLQYLFVVFHSCNYSSLVDCALESNWRTNRLFAFQEVRLAFCTENIYGNDFGAILEFSFEGINIKSFSYGNRTRVTLTPTAAIQVLLD